MPASRLALLFVLTACSDKLVAPYNTPPSASIISPVDEAMVDGSALIELSGVARDAQDDAMSLLVSWSSSVDGELGSGSPASSAGDVLLGVTSLTDGDHVLTLTVVDTDGESASDAVKVTVTGGGGADGGDGGVGTAPTVVLAGPGEGETFGQGSPVTFVGKITDAEQAADTLAATLVSSRDGVVWSGLPATDGRIDVDLSTLSLGAHTVTLEGLDADGNTGSDDVVIEIIDDGRPTVSITSPSAAASPYWTDVPVVFQGVVGDDATDLNLLAVSWATDLQGTLLSGYPDSAGNTATSASLVEGNHVVTLTATDEEGKIGSSTVVIEVKDPNNFDNDGDGYTENEGDCDDGDTNLSPGEVERCDDLDNDCDGMVNDDWWDTYELNETSADAYDLGEVGTGLWSSASVTLSGLSLHEADDEDWFQWVAEDIFLIDNVVVKATISGLPTSGSGVYVAELWLDTGSGYALVTSTSGRGTLTLNFTGDEFDDDETDFALRVYAQTWPSGTCTTTYSVRITS